MGLSPRRSMHRPSGPLSHRNTLVLAGTVTGDQVPREADNALNDAPCIPSQTSAASDVLTGGSTFSSDEATLSRAPSARAPRDALGTSVSQQLAMPRASTVQVPGLGGTLPRGTLSKRPSQPGAWSLPRETRKSGTGRRSQWKAPLLLQAEGPRVQAGQWMTLYIHTSDAAGNPCTSGGSGHMFTCHSVHQSMQNTALDHQFRCEPTAFPTSLRTFASGRASATGLGKFKRR